jgi:nitrogen fixation/metabolism regulation signal transduction histidine kinase
LAVYDNGSGIQAEQIETIFEPYVSTKTKGTGLGLAIVKKIIEEHGGVIWLDTSYNNGAGFIIQLPVFEFGSN